MKESSFLKARNLADSASHDSTQELNKQWWENLPMTYEDWGKDDRLPKDFAVLNKVFLERNPWISKNFDFSKWKNKRVLEIGCGSAAATCLFAKAQASVVAIDLTEMATKLTKMNALGQNLIVEVYNMDAEKTSFESESFDFVFSWGVLHHSSAPHETFREVGRLLCSGGGADNGLQQE